MSSTAYGLICQELERADSGVRSFVSVQGSLVMYPIYAYGSEEQRKKWLPKMAKGEVIGCFGLTEPNFGSNPSGMLTNAKKVDGGFVLNGSKMWITNGSIADVAVVWAKDESGVVKGFLVEKEFEGFTAPIMKGKWSLRASITSELVLDNVFVPEENLLPNVEGLKGPLGCLNQARYGIGWGAIGAAMNLYEVALNYSKDRQQFGKPLSKFQAIQQQLAIFAEECAAVNCATLAAARSADLGDGSFENAATKLRANRSVGAATSIAHQVHGAIGFTKEYDLHRFTQRLWSWRSEFGNDRLRSKHLGQQVLAAKKGGLWKLVTSRRETNTAKSET